ncbi:MAG: hypothetical protein GXZ04_04450 [Clostridiales bacterium]|nr:hypothetical protein [Clostridiales bacterium]
MKNEAFDTIVNRRLSSISFKGETQVLKALRAQDKPRMPATHRRFRLAIVMAILLFTLLIGTALALGLRYTAGYSARKAADKALMQKYHFEQDTIGLFWVKESKQGEGTLFTYIPHMSPRQNGEYQVLLKVDGQAVATWSLDDADPAQYQSGSLENPIWGPQQMNSYVRLKNAYYNKAAEFDWENVSKWTLEQRAEVFGLLRKMQLAYGETNAYQDIVPDAGDIQPEAAIRMAKEHLQTSYGLSAQYFEGFTPTMAFQESLEDPLKRYQIQFRNAQAFNGHHLQGAEIFSVSLRSPSGTFEKISWFLSDTAKRQLPKGDLTPYHHAVSEYMQSGAFELLSAADKGKLAQRMVKAGMVDLLKDTSYIIPGPGVMDEARALQAAQDAFKERYGLSPDMLTLFDASAALIKLDGQVVWQVVYSAREVLRWDNDAKPPIGEYTVMMRTQTGQPIQVSWSLEGVETGSFTRSTWGQAQAYGASVLPYFKELVDAQEPILLKYGPGEWYDMSVPDQAAYDKLYRDSGFSKERFPHDLPGPQDLTEEEARALAFCALREELQLSEQIISELNPVYPYFLRYASYAQARVDRPVWAFRFHHLEGIYVVYLSAQNGELILVEYEPAAAGNG